MGSSKRNYIRPQGRTYLHAKKVAEMKRVALGQIEADLRDGARERTYITVRNRRVSILPFFANAVSFIDRDGSLELFSMLYAEDERELLEVAKKEEKWYVNNIGVDEYNILEGLCGHPSRCISRHLIVGAMKDFDRFYKVMVIALLQEAASASRDGDLTNEYSQGVQNTMALSYYICIKWIRDGNFLLPGKFNLDFVDNTIDKILSVPGPLQDYFEGRISESEFKMRQLGLESRPDRTRGLSPLFKEVLESYGINTSLQEVKDNEERYIVIANDLAIFRASETLTVFNNGISGIILESNMLTKVIKERDYLKNELESLTEIKNTSQRELRHSKKELKKIKQERDRLIKEVCSLKEKSSQLPEETRKCIDDLNNKLFIKEDRIKELADKLEELKKELAGTKKENSDLKKQVKKLTAKLDITLEENQLMQDELDSIRESDIDESIPLCDILSEIKNKRIVVVGGAECIGQGLADLGLDVKQYDVNTNIGTKDLGNYDCLVFMLKYVPHTSVWAAKNEAKKLGKPIVYFYGTNIETICRNVYEKLKELYSIA